MGVNVLGEAALFICRLDVSQRGRVTGYIQREKDEWLGKMVGFCKF
jgi:hypothetical protein